jgi:hypothetical protein
VEKRGNYDKVRSPNLAGDMELTVSQWPTPTVADVQGGRKHRSGKRSNELLLNGLMAATWATPMATDPRQGYQRRPGDKKGSQKSLMTQIVDALGLGENVTGFRDATEPSGAVPSGSPATTGKRGAPNPAFPCWLMGFPAVWLLGAVSATQSCLRLRRESSAR